jgi:hypothetical protein
MALNSDTPWPSVADARRRVLCIQRKLHQWSKADAEKRFDDLFNLVVTDTKSVVRYLAGIGELTLVPGRSPSRGPPYWESVALRRKALADAA